MDVKSFMIGFELALNPFLEIYLQLLKRRAGEEEMVRTLGYRRYLAVKSRAEELGLAKGDRLTAMGEEALKLLHQP